MLYPLSYEGWGNTRTVKRTGQLKIIFGLPPALDGVRRLPENQEVTAEGPDIRVGPLGAGWCPLYAGVSCCCRRSEVQAAWGARMIVLFVLVAAQRHPHLLVPPTGPEPVM